MAEAHPTSRNVDALIERLRSEGVAAGRAEAERLRADAEREAAAVLASARAEAEALRAQARTDAERFRAAGEEALEIAMRDAIMTMKSDLIAQLEADVRRMVSSAVADPEMLKQMILELVGAARDETGLGGRDGARVQVFLPADLLAEDGASPDSAGAAQAARRDDPLTRFALGLAQDKLKQGVVFFADETLGVGLRARLEDRDLTIDLSDAAIAALLTRRLQPRFRAILEGMIR